MRNEAVYDALRGLRAAGGAGLVATVTGIRGSSPGALGAKMLLTPDGRTVGTVGGGCVDGQVYAELRDVLRAGRPRRISVDLTGRDDPEQGLICGGRVELLLDPLPEGAAPDDALYAALEGLRERGEPGALLTVVGAAAGDAHAVGSKLLVDAAGAPLAASGAFAEVAVADAGGPLARATAAGGLGAGALAERVQDALGSERPCELQLELGAGALALFVEPILTTHLVICGSGHIAHALARLAAPLDFQLTVLDDRRQFLNEERFPGARLLLGEFDDLLREVRAPVGAYVAVVTRGHRHDQACLEWALRQERPRYVGLVGSRAKIHAIVGHLRAQGVSEERLALVRTPIGLDLGAVTVEEIAVAVAAELIAVRRRGPTVSRDLRQPGRLDARAARLARAPNKVWPSPAGSAETRPAGARPAGDPTS